MKKFLLLLAVFALVACGGAAPTVPPGAGVDEVVITSTPQRIVALGEDGLLADLLALGIKPVGASVNVVDAVKGVAPEELEGIQLFPTQETNLESLTALNPDLIIVYASYLEYIKFDMLSQIATTVVIDSSDEFQAYVDTAKLFDKQAEARAEVDAFRARIQSEREQLAADSTVTVATIYPGPSLAVWVDGPIAAPQLLLDLGYILRPDKAEAGDVKNGRAFLSMEKVPLLDGDVLILLQSSSVEGEDAAVAEIQADPLWAQLPAVQSGRVHVIDRLGYFGFTGRQRLLDDLLVIVKSAQ